MDKQLIANGGIQSVPQIALQYIYLDFDGELTSYNGEISTIDKVEVKDSALSEKRIADIVSELNVKYAAQNVVFVTERPQNTEYSTIYIGKNSAFDEYGNFAGVAETIDHGNLNKSDNAFVMMDADFCDETIISTISHETDHLLGTLDHGGEGLEPYAAIVTVAGRSSGLVVSSNSTVQVVNSGNLQDTTVLSGGVLQLYNTWVSAYDTVLDPGGKIYVSGGNVKIYDTVVNGGSMVIETGTAYDTTVNGGSVKIVNGNVSGAEINSSASMIFYAGRGSGITVNPGGSLIVNSMYASVGAIKNNGGYIEIASGASVSFVRNSFSGVKLDNGQKLIVYSGTTACSTTVSAGNMVISSGGFASDTRLLSGGTMYVTFGEVNNTVISSGGVLNGSMGARISDTVISSGGTLSMYTGVHTGKLHIKNGGKLYLSNLTRLDFTVSGTVADNSFIFDAEQQINVSAGKLIYVSPVQETGRYNLARNLTGSASFTIQCSYLSAGETISVNGSPVVCGSRSYSLTSSANCLYLDVSDEIPTPLFVYSSGAVVYSGTNYSGAVLDDKNLNKMVISAGGRCTDMQINSGGKMVIKKDGVAINLTVASGGSLDVGRDAFISGTIYVEEGAHVYTYCSIIDFTVASRSTEDDFLINNLSAFNGTSNSYSITVSAQMAEGTYKLAAGAALSSDTLLMIKTENDEMRGTITVNGESFYLGYTEYSLVQNNNQLMLNVVDHTPPSVFIYSGATIPGDPQAVLESSGRYFDGITLTSFRYMTVSSGGVIKNTGIDGFNCHVVISSGGYAENIRINENTPKHNQLTVLNGAVASNVYIHDYGILLVDSSGFAKSVAAANLGSVCILSGGTASDITGTSDARIFVSSGGTAELGFNPWGTTPRISAASGAVVRYLERNANVYYGCKHSGVLSKADCISNLNVTSNNSALVYSGGTVKNTTVNSGGHLYVSSSGTAEKTILQSKGGMYISSGGTASDTTVNSGGYLYVSSGGTAEKTILQSKGEMNIFSGGTASDTTVNTGGTMFIASGGTANDTAVNSSGSMHVYSGGAASDTTVNSEGKMYVCSGGSANNATVESGGYLVVSSGGSALEIKENGGYVSVTVGADVTFVSHTIEEMALNYTGMTVHQNTIANSTTVNSYGSMYISSGGSANCTTINSNGYMHVFNGGTASDTTVNSGGNMNVCDSGTANSTIINSSGYMYVFSGGSANCTTINSNGYMYVCADGTAESIAVNPGGHLYVSSGGTAESIKINSGGIMYVFSGGAAENTAVNGGGLLYVSSGGTASIEYTPWRGNVSSAVGAAITYLQRDANVYYGNSFSGIIYKADSVSGLNVTSGNSALIYSGGTASGTVVNSGGSMRITDRSIHKGSLQIESGAFVWAHKNAIIEFTVFERTTQDGYLINDLALLTGTPTYTITVSADQESGTYKLAQGAENFNGSITVGTSGSSFGSITVGEKLSHGNVDYILTNTSGNLELTIGDFTPPELAVAGNPESWTNKDVILTAAANEDGSIEYFDGNNWVAGDTLTVSVNGTYTFKVTDAAGNVTEKSVTVDKIDKVAPSLEITGNATELTHQDIVLSAAASDGIIEFFNGDNWITGDHLTVSENGTYTFRVTDAAGNVTEKSVEVTCIDKIAPTLEIKEPSGNWTNKNIVITAASSDGIIEYQIGSKWYSGNKITVMNNGTYTFRATDAAGNMTEKTVTVDYIDKTAPALEISGDTSTQAAEVTLTAIANDNASGISEVWYSLDNKTWLKGSSVTVSQKCKVYFKAKDQAGNISIVSREVYNILTADDQFVRNDLFFNGHSQILAWNKESGAVGRISIDGNTPAQWRGVWDWNNAEAAHWRVAGIGHFKGSEVDYDGILLYGSNNTFAAWTDLNAGDYGYVSLCYVDNTFQTKTIANFDNNEYDDILIVGDTGSVAVVLDGTTYINVWHVIDQDTNVWEIAGAGDFGKETDSLIYRNTESGHYFRWDNLDTSFATWDWALHDLGSQGENCTLAAIGDFAGDGIDDLVMFDTVSREVWIWNDGDNTQVRLAGIIDENTVIETVGDYDGNGCEDLLLREQNSGWGGLEYWGNGDSENKVSLNTGIENKKESNYAIIA